MPKENPGLIETTDSLSGFAANDDSTTNSVVARMAAEMRRIVMVLNVEVRGAARRGLIGKPHLRLPPALFFGLLACSIRCRCAYVVITIASRQRNLTSMGSVFVNWFACSGLAAACQGRGTGDVDVGRLALV